MESLLMTYDELSLSPGFSVLCSGTDRGFSSVSIDSRKILPGALFVALTGTAVDGHSFIEAALKAGASGIMAAKSRLESFNIVSLAKARNKTLLAAENTLTGLQNAAAIYLRKFPKLIKIAITGSAGKTTTKEIAAAVISREKKVICNSGNLNSETGLPLSVFNVREEHEAGIFEAGMNRRGEIAELAGVLNPDIALITNVGSAHIGILGSRQAIAEEKKQIFSRFNGTQKALIPAEDEFKDFLAANVAGKIIFYGQDSFAQLESCRSLGLAGTEIFWAGEKINFPLPGAFNFKNALAALAIARELSVSDKSAAEGLRSVKPLFGRGEIFNGKVTLIRDCYNSNPESLEAALSYCDSVEWPGRKVYIIGSMLELGGISEDAHRQMGLLLSRSNAEMVFLYGAETEAAAEQLTAGGKKYFKTVKMDELKQALGSFIKQGDLVLLKGSRGCALEELTPVITGDEVRAANVNGTGGQNC
ncbi:MAG: UDP-N-acetylmuramoyl-tripeptide--D-alanyl-D-alanine ligase [Treponema sp.]|nr:UDP-N-acetylmuramoyl-tripeptide--D-alanyl-D-alanine ligase [Treponema sp.]